MRTRPVLGILLLALLLVIGAAGRATAAEAPVLLADVNRELAVPSIEYPPEPTGFFQVGDRLLFSTGSSNLEDEGILWSTDGTAEGTRAISSSLCPVPCNGIRPLAVWHGLGLLQTSSGDSYYDAFLQLWRTDGTTAGTIPLTGTRINAQAVVSSPEPGIFYFSGCRRKTPYDCVLWRSDWTRAGTSAFQDARGAKFYDPHRLTFWRGQLYFIAGDGEKSGLWSTDGTPGGTSFVAAVGEDDERLSVLQTTPSRLFFSSGKAAEDLWVTDGTPEGTRRLVDLDPSGCQVQPNRCAPSDLESMFTFEDKVYFITHRKNHGTEIWSSDGTAGGTRPLIEMATGSDLGQPVRVHGRWLVPVSAAPGQPATLWTADGGFTRLEPLSGCAGGVCPQQPFEDFFVFLHLTDSGAWLFAGRDEAHGDEVWITDGTAAGTRRLADTCPGPCAGYRGRYLSSAIFGSAAGKTYFAAFSNPSTSTSVLDELWVTDGTPAGTHRVTGHVSELGFLGDLAVFGTGGYETSRSTIWSTDGTAAGTLRLTDLRTIAPGSDPELHPLRNGVVFVADEGDRRALWASDGRPEGTSRLLEFAPDRTVSPLSGDPWIRVRDFLLFQVSAGTEDGSRSELWRTDGTARGTGPVATFASHISLDLLTSWNGKLLFQTLSSSPSPGICSFWSSDGTAAGTREILPPEPGRRCATAVLALGSRFVFVARAQGPDGLVPQIFVSDGTPEGTRQISRIRSPREAFDLAEPAVAGGVAFFQIFLPGSVYDWELWRTDGTPQGTYRANKLTDASDLYGFRDSLYLSAPTDQGLAYFRISVRGGEPVLLVQTGSYYDFPPPAEFTPLGDRLLFAAPDSAHGFELWVTDGTPAGTRRLRDIRPGPASSLPAGLIQAGDRVFFTAEDGEHGRELWVSDGTPEGTRLVWDLHPGGFSSLFYFVEDPLTVSGRHLFFSADDGETGLEPWSLRIPSPTPRGW